LRRVSLKKVFIRPWEGGTRLSCISNENPVHASKQSKAFRDKRRAKQERNLAVFEGEAMAKTQRGRNGLRMLLGAGLPEPN